MIITIVHAHREWKCIKHLLKGLSHEVEDVDNVYIPLTKKGAQVHVKEAPAFR